MFQVLFVDMIYVNFHYFPCNLIVRNSSLCIESYHIELFLLSKMKIILQAQEIYVLPLAKKKLMRKKRVECSKKLKDISSS